MELSKIFPMTEGDLPGVQLLSEELGYPCELSQLKERFQVLDRHPQHALFVWRDGGVLGFIHLERVLDLLEEDKVEIKALVVSSDTRSKGIGKALVARSRAWAREQGLSIVYLNCNLKREKAHAFYLREGFKIVKTSHFFEGEA